MMLVHFSLIKGEAQEWKRGREIEIENQKRGREIEIDGTKRVGERDRNRGNQKSGRER